MWYSLLYVEYAVVSPLAGVLSGKFAPSSENHSLLLGRC